MIGALLMAMVDRYPGTPPIPSWGDLQVPMSTLAWSLVVTVVLAALLGRFLPSTPLFKHLVLTTPAGGTPGVTVPVEQFADLQGAVGVAQSPLRPAGKALFGERLVDVVTQGEMMSSSTVPRCAIAAFSIAASCFLSPEKERPTNVAPKPMSVC